MESRAQFALDVVTRSLDFFERYFGIPFPLPKLDMIAVGNHPAGIRCLVFLPHLKLTERVLVCLYNLPYTASLFLMRNDCNDDLVSTYRRDGKLRRDGVPRRAYLDRSTVDLHAEPTADCACDCARSRPPVVWYACSCVFSMESFDPFLESRLHLRLIVVTISSLRVWYSSKFQPLSLSLH